MAELLSVSYENIKVKKKIHSSIHSYIGDVVCEITTARKLQKSNSKFRETCSLELFIFCGQSVQMNCGLYAYEFAQESPVSTYTYSTFNISTLGPHKF
jgi:hypothetical protein